jgi:hypothetical protein
LLQQEFRTEAETDCSNANPIIGAWSTGRCERASGDDEWKAKRSRSKRGRRSSKKTTTIRLFCLGPRPLTHIERLSSAIDNWTAGHAIMARPRLHQQGLPAIRRFKTVL